MATAIAYKVLGEGGEAFHGGTGTWPLPRGKRPGKWFEHEGRLIACESGLHLCRKQDLVKWLGPVIYEAEYDDTEVMAAPDKIVVRRARLVRRLGGWNERNARLFAADCAARALRMEQKAGRSVDPRSKNAIKVARAFANGKATDAERSAARSAAWSGARSAAESAAWSAAESAARSAAWSGAWSWQTKSLFGKYLEA